MRKLILTLLLGASAVVCAQAPQVPITGTIGSGGMFAFRNANPISMTDADLTLSYPATSAGFVKVTSSVSLTAQRSIVEPFLTNGQCFENLTSGGQSIQIIGASGTGVVITNGTYACVQGDGTNYVTGTSSGGGSTVGPQYKGAVYNGAGSGSSFAQGFANWGTDSTGNNLINGAGYNSALNFLSGTTDLTYQIHASSASHNQFLTETTDSNQYALVWYKTPTNLWQTGAAGHTTGGLADNWYIFDATNGQTLFQIAAATGNTIHSGAIQVGRNSSGFLSGMQVDGNGLYVGTGNQAAGAGNIEAEHSIFASDQFLGPSMASRGTTSEPAYGFYSSGLADFWPGNGGIGLDTSSNLVASIGGHKFAVRDSSAADLFSVGPTATNLNTTTNFGGPTTFNSYPNVFNQNDLLPGYSLGNAVLGPTGWYGIQGISQTFNSFSQSLEDVRAVFGNKNGDGDYNGDDQYWRYNGGITATSDEGGTGGHNYAYIGTDTFNNAIATGGGGAGATVLTFAGTATGEGDGIGRPLVDSTTGVLSTTITGSCTTAGAAFTQYSICPISTTVQPAVQGTAAQDVIIAANALFPSTSSTFNINTTTALSVGDLVAISGLYYQQTRVTAVGALSGGVQSITAPLWQSVNNGAFIWAQHAGTGLVGRPLEINADSASTGGIKHLMYVLGAVDATHIAVAYKVQVGMAELFLNAASSFPINITIYHGAPVIDVRNPSTGLVDGAHMVLEANDAAWANGDNVIQPSALAQAYALSKLQINSANPYSAGNAIAGSCTPGPSCGSKVNAATNGVIIWQNANNYSNYTSNGWHTIPFMAVAGPFESIIHTFSTNGAPLQFLVADDTTQGATVFAAHDQAAGYFLNAPGTSPRTQFVSDSFRIQAGFGTGSDTDVDVQGNLRFTTTGAITCTVGGASGTGSTCSVAAGATTNAGNIAITTGTSPSASGVLVSVIAPTTVAPQGCIIGPTTATAAAQLTDLFTTINSGGWQIKVGATPLAASTTYNFTYHCF